MSARPTIHVVAGLLVRGTKICLTRRRLDSHQGGKWEFPGGKVEPGEAALAALKRELDEEIGIEVRQAQPFRQVRHAYAEREVLLDVWRVTDWRGEPHGREGQELRWAELGSVAPHDLPEADRPILRALQLPPLYVISDAQRLGLAVFTERLEQALRAGVQLVQLREPMLDRAAFCAYAREISVLCRRYGTRLLINADASWVEECQADGVHLKSAQLMTLTERPLGSDGWVAASCHNAAELARAEALQLDLAVLGPVRPTTSHPLAQPLGWERFREMAEKAAIPIYALGGMQAVDAATAKDCGAQGLAMIRGMWDQDTAAVAHAVHQAFASVR